MGTQPPQNKLLWTIISCLFLVSLSQQDNDSLEQNAATLDRFNARINELIYANNKSGEYKSYTSFSYFYRNSSFVILREVTLI